MVLQWVGFHISINQTWSRTKQRLGCFFFFTLVMSAIEELQLVYQCLCRGATDYLVKPVRQQQLQNLWQNVWRKRQEQKLLSMYEHEKGQKNQMVSFLKHKRIKKIKTI
jgi:response regulator of citrate/malate metabolism